VPNSVSSSSTISSTTVRAQVLAAEADHLRRIADIDERTLATERAEREQALVTVRAVVEAEHRALVASLEAQSNGNCRFTNRAVQVWLNGGDDNPPNISLFHHQTPVMQVTSHAPSVRAPFAPEDAMVVPPKDATSSGQNKNTEAYTKFTTNTTKTLQLAEAVANIAIAAESRTAKVSVTLPLFDGKPTDWLLFSKAT
jgi:hypothetical protein